MDPSVAGGIKIGLVGGTAGLFLLHLVPMLRDPSLRFPEEFTPQEQIETPLRALITVIIGFAAVGVTVHVVGDMVCELIRSGGELPEGALWGG